MRVPAGDEYHPVGVAYGLLGELAAQFAGGLVNAGRVDQNELGVLETALGYLMGGAVLARYREDLLAGERIQQCALAGADFTEGRDLDPAVLELGGKLLDVLHLP